VSTTSAIAMLAATEVAVVAALDPNIAASAVASALALLVGGFLVAARVLRLGFLANFMSEPVLVGFKAGVGVAIMVGQLKSVLGVSFAGQSTMAMLRELPGVIGQTHWPTLLVAVTGVVLLLGLPMVFARISAPLVWVAASIAACALAGEATAGIKLVGEVPAGLPPWVWPDLKLASLLWPAALGIALMSYTETMAAARTFCRGDDPPVNANGELLALGAANLAASVVAGMPAGGGASQTAIADVAGVRSQLAQWVAALAVLVTLWLLSPLIALLPKAALGALILTAAASMIKPESFRAIARVRRDEFMWALVTLGGVIVMGTLQGILIAVAISMLTLLYQANHPPVYALAWNRAQRIFRRAGEDPSDETFAGLLMLRTEGRLYFANAANAAERMQALVAQAQPRVIALECSAIPDIEYTALMMLTQAEQTLRARGVTLWLVAVNPGLLKTIARSSLGASLGSERMFANLHQALAQWQKTEAQAMPTPASSTSAPVTGVQPAA
jgi:MFS superfamily sulfate permease-like transporter